MKLLIKSAKIIDNESPFDGKIMDLLIEDRKIVDVASNLDSTGADQEISSENLHVSPGWFDSSVNFGEPGFEERETIENGLKTAALSGFTAVALNPANIPVTDNQGAVSFLKNKTHGYPVSLHPIGSLTVKQDGKALAELYDMHMAGAVAFGDYKKPIANPNLLKLALLYAQNFDGLVLSFPSDVEIAGQGVVNENQNSTSLGLRGIPPLAEELQIIRDLYILEYTGGKLHIPTISTAKAVEIIRRAKENGLDVSCGVAIHNLLFTDDALAEFDTNAKVLPPLRTKEDLRALLGGIKDGTIDMITTDHSPVDQEHKKTEFDNADFGTLGLESALGSLLKVLPLKTSIKLLTSGRSRFDIQETTIMKGASADLTLFNPEEKFIFSEGNIQSTSKNSLFLGQQLKGKVCGVISQGIFSEAKVPADH